MGFKIVWKFLALAAISLSLSGCLTNPADFISISIPEIPQPEHATSAVKHASGKLVVIRVVVDERTFAEKPKDSSVPSLRSSDTQPRAIARKHADIGNTRGGGVLLQEGQTVEKLVRDYLTTALEQSGYKVVRKAPARSSARVIDVHIKQFWAWAKAGFSSVTYSANISTDIRISGVRTPLSVSVHAEESHMMPSTGAWTDVIQKALTDYQAAIVADAKRGRL